MRTARVFIGTIVIKLCAMGPFVSGLRWVQHEDARPNTLYVRMA